MKRHAVADYPRESVGFVVMREGKETYVPAKNVAPENSSTDHFVVHPQEYSDVEDSGQIVMFIHSHPNASAKPSEADLVSCEASNLPWGIISVYKDLGTGEIVAHDPMTFEPSGYEAPLIGRRFYHGVTDCYTLVRDYYKRVVDIELPQFDRPDFWWENPNTLSLYVANFTEAGFVQVDGPPRIHDVIIMEIRSQAGPNHAGVMYDEHTMLHHLFGQLSGRVPYGGYWQEHTALVVRHKELIGRAQ